MNRRADAHIHLFDGGYQGGSFASRPGVAIDEAACYASLMADHGVEAALVVGYQGADWTAGNNDYLARVVQQHQWVHPVAGASPGEALTVEVLEGWLSQGFVGFSLYVFGEEQTTALQAVPGETWSACVEKRCLVSVNSKGDDWLAWRSILEKHPDLRLIVSHLGLPPAQSEPPSMDEARSGLSSVLGLAEFPGARVKLSGFYALTEPRWDYPHQAAWPYVEALLDGFGAERLLWASDFSPSLDWLTFPQTFGLFVHMPFLDDDQRSLIEGENLLGLLADARSAKS